MRKKSKLLTLALGACMALSLGLTSCVNGCPHDNDGRGYEKDATHHWYVCNDCGENFDKAEHSFKDGTCEVCGATSSEEPGTEVELNSISLNKTELTLEVDAKETLTVTTDPENYDGTAKWTSSDKTIASVSTKGKVTAKKEGTATITVKIGDKTAECVVTVVAAGGGSETPTEKPCTSVSLNKTSVSLEVNGTETLVATTDPSDTTDTVEWRTGDASVATVANGVVTAVGVGSTTITVQCGNQTAECTVTVTAAGGGEEPGGSETPTEIECTSITLDQSTITLDIGATQTLIETVLPADTTDTVAWYTDDATIATVADGVVTAVGVGTTTITVQCGVQEAECTVTVEDLPAVLEFSISAPGVNKFKVGLQKAITVTATIDGEPATDPAISWVSSNEAVATVDSNGKVTCLTGGTTTITATWTPDDGSEAKTATMNITVSANTLSLNTKQYVEMGVTDSAFDFSSLHENYLKNYTLTAATFGGTNIKSALTEAGGSVYSVNNTYFSSMALGTTMAGEFTFTNPDNSTDKWVVSAQAMIVTQALRDKADIDGFLDVAYAQEGAGEQTNASGVKYGLWKGYFVLANDIQYNPVSATIDQLDEYYQTMTYQWWVATYGSDALWSNGRIGDPLYGGGFDGTFDGQGYKIDKLCVSNNHGTTSSGAFIGKLSTNGIIKNVAFTNAYHLGCGGFLTATGHGTVEDVYIQAAYQAREGWEHDRSGFVFSKDIMEGAAVRRVVVKVDSRSAFTDLNSWTLGAIHFNYGIYQQVFSICDGDTTSCDVLSDTVGSGTPDTWMFYNTLAEFKNGATGKPAAWEFTGNFVDWTASVWSNAGAEIVS